MIKVGIKYCGGCNPYYDRVALVKRIERRLKGKVTFVSASNDDADLVLAVEGCGTACADLSLFDDNNIRIITHSEDADRFIQEILG
jgi:transcription antitermination factor NusA-like protein